MRKQYARFVDLGAEILNVGPESAEKFAAFWKEHDMPFVGLGDPKHKVAKQYGQAVRLLKLGRMPLQLIVDLDGRIQQRHDSNSMSDIPSLESVFEVLQRLAPASP